ncbi:unnamed protein product [Durusdinium trenchii]|uniref:Uncharacterized protein n=1 Tax=Durusdinium trenchii TaxID=1381693 RepID=A0ABP0NA85_9DINO
MSVLGHPVVAHVAVEFLEIGGVDGAWLALHALGEVQSSSEDVSLVPPTFSFRASFDATWRTGAFGRFLAAEPLQIELLTAKSYQQVARFQLRPWAWLEPPCRAHDAARRAVGLRGAHGLLGVVRVEHRLTCGETWMRLRLEAGVAEDPSWFDAEGERLLHLPEKGQIIHVPHEPKDDAEHTLVEHVEHRWPLLLEPSDV